MQKILEVFFNHFMFCLHDTSKYDIQMRTIGTVNAFICA